MSEIGYWFCCLNPREREVLRLTIEGLALTLYVGVPVAVWDTFWFGFSDSGESVREAFLWVYLLHIGTIMVDEVPVDVVQADTEALALYVSWALWLLEPAASCPDGCEQSKFY